LEFSLDDSHNFTKECAAHGYVGVVATARPPKNSRTRVDPYRAEGEDARAVIEWIAKQPWSDGRVGMYGEGYSGFAAWAAAKLAIPALKAIATAAPTAPGVDFPMAGSIFRTTAFPWSLGVTHDDPAVESAVRDDAVWRALDQKWYESGRRFRDMFHLYGAPNPLFLRWLNHPSYDRYWQRMIPFQKQFGGINIPVLTVTGYYAFSEPGALYYFNQHVRYNPRANHSLVIGPYDDAGLARGPSPGVPGADAAAAVDLHELRYQWFDHVLKGAAAPAVVKDRVNYEVMGANEWRHAPSLEDLDKEPRRFYLHVDPAAPSRPHGTRKSSKLQFAQQSMSFADRSDAQRLPSTDLISRTLVLQNGLMFASEALAKSVDFAGLFSGRLDFTVNKMDMDFEISLYEQTASGDYVRLFEPGAEFRASYVRDRVHRHLLKAGVREELIFRSERMTGRRLKAGSRLVIILSLAKRPDREINYGTGNDVSDESLSDDGSVPLRVRWYSDSYIDVPMGR